jgi:hypothetical protein
MKLAMVFAIAFGSFPLVTGCSSSSGGGGATGPVATTPLAGTVDGQSFTAKTALAHDGFDSGKKSIDIYDTDVNGEAFGQSSKREILLDVDWTAGSAKDFSLGSGTAGQTATFVVDKNGTPDNIISTTGRVEIIDAPTTKGSTGKMRLRATAEGNQVEGEVPVQVCE